MSNANPHAPTLKGGASPVIERKQFCHILDALGCSCSPPVPGTDTGWSLNPHCLMHGEATK